MFELLKACIESDSPIVLVRRIDFAGFSENNRSIHIERCDLEKKDSEVKFRLTIQRTLSLLITPFDVNTSRPSAGVSQRSSVVGSDFSIGFDVVVVGRLHEIDEDD